MTTLLAYDQVDITSLDLNLWLQYWDHYEFNNDAFNPYEDDYHIVANTGDSLSLYGNGFGIDGSGQLVTGTIEALSQFVFIDSVKTWVERFHWAGWNASAADLNAAMNTVSTADDFALIRQQMAGKDILQLSEFGDQISGFGGNDRILGMGGADTLHGNNGNDKMFGGDDNDVLFGDDGFDTLNGGRNNDMLYGGDRIDTLSGGKGRDHIWGGTGEDIFKFTTGDDYDFLEDFDAAGVWHDRVDLSGLVSIRSWYDLRTNHLTVDGANLVIDGGDGDVIVLVNVTRASLDSGDFIF